MTVDVSKQLDRAKRFLEKNRIEDAIETYQSILNESPGHAESLQAVADLYTRLGQVDRAMNYYGLLFDRLCEFREDNKAAAIYSRALKGVQQPAERMARYGILLQKQNRSDEAIEQFTLASELLLARGREEPALDYVIEHLEELVVKGAFPNQHFEPVFGRDLDADGRTAVEKRRAIMESYAQWLSSDERKVIVLDDHRSVSRKA